MTRFYSCHKLYDFGGRRFNIRDVCMDFEPCFKIYNLVPIRPKSMKLGQMTNLNAICHIVGSVYRFVTIRNSPQFPVEFWNGLFAWSFTCLSKIFIRRLLQRIFIMFMLCEGLVRLTFSQLFFFFFFVCLLFYLFFNFILNNANNTITKRTLLRLLL